MARIRTIKPEFPQSETVGRLSRDARLLYILLWTIVDDHGRARASSRMLASLLYPYDDDVPGLIDDWIDELEAEGCLRRYVVDGSHYLDLPNWLKHQKIDRPTGSKLPAFDEGSPITREDSRGLDAVSGPRTLDLGPRTIDPSLRSGSVSATKNADDPEPDAPAKTPAADIAIPLALRRDVQTAFEFYNATAAIAGWPVAQVLSPPRRRSLAKRLDECGGTEAWREAMERASRSTFLTGGNDSGWKADLDFFLQAKSFTKLMEGSYDDRDRKPGTNGKPSAHDAILRAVADEFAPGAWPGGDHTDADERVRSEPGAESGDREPSFDLSPADYRRQ